MGSPPQGVTRRLAIAEASVQTWQGHHGGQVSVLPEGARRPADAAAPHYASGAIERRSAETRGSSRQATLRCLFEVVWIQFASQGLVFLR